MKNIMIYLNQKVSDLMDAEEGSWSRRKLEDQFFQRDVDIILKYKPIPDQDD